VRTVTAILVLLIAACPAFAGIDLVTLPERDSVQLTIYNSADLTLVREVRKLTLKKGTNKLSFGWANTLIDPTSLSLRATERPDAVRLLDISYPPRINTQGIWTVESEVEGEVPVEITFFTSGISWRAFYMATLTADEKAMRLQGYVRATNRSGEDYEDAQTRLIVGKIHILDQIAALARRKAPYGRPGARYRHPHEEKEGGRQDLMFLQAKGEMVGARLKDAKKIIKQGLSEYFLYTIEGTETIRNGWSKRLPSFAADAVPVTNLYKYEQRRYGTNVVRFLYFRNDKKHKLGETPLPGGLIKVYRLADGEGHLAYEGAIGSKYIPVEQKVELNLGAARKVKVEPKMMKVKQENFTFDRNGNVSGWDEVQDWKVEVKNNRDVAIRVEVTRNLKHQHWQLKRGGDYGEYKKDDLDTVKFTLELKPNTKKEFTCQVRYYEGERRNRR